MLMRENPFSSSRMRWQSEREPNQLIPEQRKTEALSFPVSFSLSPILQLQHDQIQSNVFRRIAILIKLHFHIFAYRILIDAWTILFLPHIDISASAFPHTCECDSSEK